MNISVERFNGSLKNMLTSYIGQYAGEWDEAITFVLFAYRELPIAEYGYSPCELVLSKQVKSPKSILYNSWWEAGQEQATTHVIEYMNKLREYVDNALQVVHAEQRKALVKAKIWYNKNAKEVKYEEGDMVLVLKTLPNKPLTLKYEGPFKVIKMVRPVDYLISMPSKRKTEKVVHVNLMKKYVERIEFVDNVYHAEEVGKAGKLIWMIGKVGNE